MWPWSWPSTTELDSSDGCDDIRERYAGEYIDPWDGEPPTDFHDELDTSHM